MNINMNDRRFSNLVVLAAGFVASVSFVEMVEEVREEREERLTGGFSLT